MFYDQPFESGSDYNLKKSGDSLEGPAVVCASCGKAGAADIRIETDIFTRPKKTGVSKLYYLVPDRT